MGIRGFAICSVRGLSLVPKPAAKIRVCNTWGNLAKNIYYIEMEYG
jgi:alpha-glucuronidase